MFRLVHHSFRRALRAGARPAAVDFFRAATAAAAPLSTPLETPTYIVWGANTDVGKTIVSVGLAHTLAKEGQVGYLKPVQTGFPGDSDARLVSLATRQSTSLGSHATAVAAAAEAAAPLRNDESYELIHTEFAWSRPVSPHLAVQLEGNGIEDEALIQAVVKWMNQATSREALRDSKNPKLALVETAGGPCSPGPTGSLQCDLFRPLRLPSILVGDGGLGGISLTVSAYESLIHRGYDVPVVVFLEGNEEMTKTSGVGPMTNSLAFKEYLQRMRLESSTRVFSTGKCRRKGSFDGIPEKLDDQLSEWLRDSSKTLNNILGFLIENHTERLAHLRNLPRRTLRNVWYPFTQHNGLSESDITVVDARVGERLMAFEGGADTDTSSDPKADGQARIKPYFDACASWWTQVAIKMALRKYAVDHNLFATVGGGLPPLGVVGIDGGYHGDTLGAMDAVAPSPYNGPLQYPWYSGRGLFLTSPTIRHKCGVYSVVDTSGTLIGDSEGGVGLRGEWKSLEEVFDENRVDEGLYDVYKGHIEEEMQKFEKTNEPYLLATCLIEPVVQGAGGMKLIDPVFQRCLVDVCQSRKIPVIFDEVFTGLYRLGVPSAATLLNRKPDVACYAKLLTGGVLPFAATMASAAVYAAFAADSNKLTALLHGHSYSGHAAGAAAGVAALDIFKASAAAGVADSGVFRTRWPAEAVRKLSESDKIESVIALGTVLAIELKADAKGYASDVSRLVTDSLLTRGIFARPLGSTVYLMLTPTTTAAAAAALAEATAAVLE